ncbi:MAG TPA: prolyl oligopeptidase family serine peptidase [Ignavibacteria bacterium]|nr:prolyl oligopeptidase family serine peptidase [Ignavibacteria bacterium]HQY52673.1 prolyl oligopeptidase family serine peptidase [Ignavibacteria bacterium]
MILSKSEIVLNSQQLRFIENGWGKKVTDETEVYNISYDSDGIEVNGYFAKPKNTETKLPLIIWNRGGHENDGRIDEFIAKGMFGEIASWGFTVMASQYRDKDEFGGKDINDILNLMKLAGEFPECDNTKIGMEGWSRGGMMTYKVLTLTDKIKCAVIVSGLADIERNEQDRDGLARAYKKLFGSEDENEFKKRKMERSAVHFYEKINKDTEILLIHGTGDDKVSHQDSLDMYELLKKNKNKCELEIIKGGDHYLTKHRKELVQLRKNWFNKFLK